LVVKEDLLHSVKGPCSIDCAGTRGFNRNAVIHQHHPQLQTLPMTELSKNACRFTSGFRETVNLCDGTSAILRLVIPADKPLLERGMDNFSPQSRFHRFLFAKLKLTNADLRYLTEIDGVDHFAIGALNQAGDGMGVARFVRFGNDREVAEPAIAILDKYQNKGLGSILFNRLMTAARERGIKRFHGTTLSGNKPMIHLLHSAAQQICFDYQGDVLEFDMQLDDITQ
jgi:GNAT superfamily N-acetyltransferase